MNGELACNEDGNGWDKMMWMNKVCNDNDDKLTTSMAQMLLLFDKNKQQHNVKWKKEKIIWDEHVKREPHAQNFESKHHMMLPKFNKLVSILKNDMDVVKSMNSTKGNTPICPELVVAIGLRFLGGEHVKSLEDIFGVDHSSVPQVIDVFWHH